ncbi:hypothetical protein HZU73_04604 [Apis mellifera caucasica]|nr:hypothetical protein HZU73_04604 [Apis mellifera caucasica]
MNVFDNQYRTYRIILKIVGLWPYDNSIYVRIQRICVLIYFLIVLFCLRYIYCLTLFSYAKLLFDDICIEEHLLQDTTEIQIQTKYLDISSHIIYIFCWLSFICVASTWIFILNPVILDVIMPLNKFRLHYSVIFLSNDRRKFIDIFLVLNSIIIFTFGLLSLICSELFTNIVSYYICRQFHIVCMPNLPKTDLKLRDIHRVVDIHCHAIELVH